MKQLLESRAIREAEQLQGERSATAVRVIEKLLQSSKEPGRQASGPTGVKKNHVSHEYENSGQCDRFAFHSCDSW